MRKDLNDKLFTQIDLRGTKHEITWRFPDKQKEWPTTQIIIGSSGVGKTHKIISEIIEAMTRRRKRKFIYMSPELNIDKTLKKVVNSKKFEKWFEGIDIGDDAFDEWRTENEGGGTAEEKKKSVHWLVGMLWGAPPFTNLSG